MTFLSLAAPEVVKMKTSSAASDANFVKMTTFSCQWCTRSGFVLFYLYHNSGDMSTHCWTLPSSYNTSHKNAHGRYNDVIMSSQASQITSLTIVYSTVYLHADQRKHQNSASLTFDVGNSPVNSPVTRKMFPFDDVILVCFILVCRGYMMVIRERI